MSSNPFQDNLVKVTDPSDWQQSKLPVMSELDSLHRCYICKELFHAPVITSCNHTFCSQCIRQYLLSSSRCPLCNAELFESNLRRDLLLEEITTCFASVRPYLLNLLKNENHDHPPAETRSVPSVDLCDEVIEISDEDTPKRSSSPVEIASKRLKLDPEPDMVECPVCGKKMPQTFLQTKHIDDCLLGKPTAPYIPRKRPNSKSSISSFFKASSKVSPSPRQSSPSSSFSPPPTDLGHKEFYFKEVHKHNLETKKLSKLDFQSLTTPKLKEKLASIKLPTSGTRLQLELRYNQFYVLYNSNLDSTRPVDEKILRQNLNKWEKSHLAFNNGTSNLFSSRNSLSNKSITDKKFLVKQWNEVYNHDFKILIQQARNSIKAKSDQLSEQETKTIPDANLEPLKEATQEVTKEEKQRANPEVVKEEEEENGVIGMDVQAIEGQDPDINPPMVVDVPSLNNAS